MELRPEDLEHLELQGYLFKSGSTRWLRQYAKAAEAIPGIRAEMLDPGSGARSYSHDSPGMAAGTSVCVVVESRLTIDEAVAAHWRIQSLQDRTIPVSLPPT